MDLTPEERNQLKLIYNSVKSDLVKAHEDKSWIKSTNSQVLLVDGFNTFMRAFSATPSMNSNGEHNGGIIGFLRSVGYAIKFLHPSRCIIAFDGIGGSFKRRKIYPDYKAKRKNKIRLNRIYEDQSNWADEEKNCLNQLLKLNHYLKFLPITVICLDHVEADDTIAYCAVDPLKESNCVIMSSDKDFLQLVDKNIRVWSPTKKLLYGQAEVIRDYGIHPNNFVLFRALDGDDSDNIDGIPGAGAKTVVKCFPFLSEEKIYSLDDIINYSIQNKKRFKIFEKVIEGKEILERNISLMQLRETLLTTTAQLMVNDLLDSSKIPRLDKNAFIKSIVDDCMINNFPDHQSWLTECFSAMDSVIRTE